MKKYGFLFLTLLLLTSCQSSPRQAESPTPAPTPTPTLTVTPMPTETVTSAGFHAPEGLELDVGDGEHKFWVETIDTGKPSYDGTVALIRIYRDREDAEPFQTFEETLYTRVPEVTPVDVDFDGNTDFSVLLHDYRSFRHSSYYIWDSAQECFVEDPYGLNNLNWAEFDTEKKIVEGKHGSMMGWQTNYYRYEQDQLLRVRVLDWGFNNTTSKIDLLVKDGWDGELETVYEYSADMDELAEGKVGTEEFMRWYDLDYPGE